MPVLLLSLFLAMTAPEPLTLTITDLSDTKATLFVAVYTEKDGFPKATGAPRGYKLEPGGKTSATLRIDDLPYGTYAIAIFQDTNGNGKLDTGAFGIPKEPYAFSNNFRPRFSAPKWADCRFEYNAQSTNQRIKLLNT
jgi:uncharacterized protein (DUF2141 family)